MEHYFHHRMQLENWKGCNQVPKPITITKEMKKKALADFTEMLKDAELLDGSLEYYSDFDYEEGSAIVWHTQEAYRKIITLITEFESEVGWHSTASRINDDEFLIEDILVYPQSVTGSTVNTDQMEYTNWLHGLDDDTFNKLRGHGHSHCNMGVFPSGVDDKHRQQIVNQLKGDMFYIFTIWNKSLDTYTLVYDMKRNRFYDNDEIEIKVLGDENMEKFLVDAKAKVSKSTYSKSNKRVLSYRANQLSLVT